MRLNSSCRSHVMGRFMKYLGGDLMRHFMNHCGDGAVAEGWHLWMEVEIVMDCVFPGNIPFTHATCWRA